MNSAYSNGLSELNKALISALLHYWWVYLLILVAVILFAIYEREIRIAIAITAVGWCAVQIFGVRNVGIAIGSLVALAILAIATIYLISRPKKVAVEPVVVNRRDDQPKPPYVK